MTTPSLEVTQVRLHRLGLVAAVLLCAGLAWPLLSRAQQPAKPAPKIVRVGLLETTSQQMNRTNYEAFRDGLRDLSYVEGQNLIIDYRSAPEAAQ